MDPLPRLYSLNAAGRPRFWQVTVEADDDEDGHPVIVTRSGMVDGAVVEQRRVVAAGKRGMTALEQAHAEALSKWSARRTSHGMTESLDDYVKPTLPMLAHPFDDRRLVLPAMLQPKLDGVRAFTHRDPATGAVVMVSRKNHQLDASPTIEAALAVVLEPGVHLDGELYMHGRSFQTIVSQVKTAADGVEYHLYDCYVPALPDMPFVERVARLTRYADVPGVRIVPTLPVDTADALMTQHQDFRRQGYEGTIVRAPRAPYIVGGRTWHLMKLKDELEDEFPIVGWSEGQGTDAGTVIWRCVVPESGEEFNVRPQGTLEQRAAMLTDAASCVGRMLTVTFHDRTDSGKPRFPSGKAVRDYEDCTSH